MSREWGRSRLGRLHVEAFQDTSDVVGLRQEKLSLSRCRLIFILRLVSPAPTPPRGVKKGPVIGAIVADLTAVLLVVSAIIIWLSRRTEYGDMILPKMRRDECVRVVSDGGPIKFTNQQMVAATQNFSELLGEGGFGKVYKGKIIVVMQNEKNAR